MARVFFRLLNNLTPEFPSRQAPLGIPLGVIGGLCEKKSGPEGTVILPKQQGAGKFVVSLAKTAKHAKKALCGLCGSARFPFNE